MVHDGCSMPLGNRAEINYAPAKWAFEVFKCKLYIYTKGIALLVSVCWLSARTTNKWCLRRQSTGYSFSARTDDIIRAGGGIYIWNSDEGICIPFLSGDTDATVR